MIKLDLVDPSGLIMYILAVIIGDLVGKRMNIRWLPEFSHCLEVEEYGSRLTTGTPT